MPLSIARLRWRFPTSYFHKHLVVDIRNWNNIEIGAGVVIHEFCTLSLMDDEFNNKKAHLKIGDNTYVGEYNNLRAGGGDLIIGNNCSISEHITIVTSNHGISKGILHQKKETRSYNW